MSKSRNHGDIDKVPYIASVCLLSDQVGSMPLLYTGGSGKIVINRIYFGFVYGVRFFNYLITTAAIHNYIGDTITPPL